TLRILPVAKSKATALVLFDDLEKAGAGVVAVLESAPSAVELLDRTFIDVIRAADARMAGSLPDGTEALLIVELEGADARKVDDRLLRREAALVGRLGLAREVRKAARPEEMARLWAVRRGASPILSRLEGRQRNTRFIE